MLPFSVKNFAKFVFSAGLLASSNLFQCILLLLIKVFLQKWVAVKCSSNMGHVTNKFVATGLFMHLSMLSPRVGGGQTQGILTFSGSQSQIPHPLGT